MCAHCPWLYFVQIFYSAISVTENLEENLGNEFSDSSSLKLIDVLGNEITDSVIPMGKCQSEYEIQVITRQCVR